MFSGSLFKISRLVFLLFYIQPLLAADGTYRQVDNYELIRYNLLDRLIFPFDLPSGIPQNKEKKVFAHYFTQFPVSHDNRDGEADYYATQYLLPDGEGGKHKYSGGFIRQRPTPRPKYLEADWALRDMRNEVARAAHIGIDGFACDVLSTSGTHWEAANRLLDAADEFGKGFKILLMPDMEAEFKKSPENMEKAIRYWWKHPAAMRSDDGSLIVAPFNAQNKSAIWWGDLKRRLESEGIKIDLFPVFQGWRKYASEYSRISVGFSDWGVRSPEGNKKLSSAPKLAKSYGVRWMAPVSPQDVRPKDLMYWEARNSENYRVMWDNAIKGDADWIQLITWNDYSESTEIAPSTGTRNFFYDLTGYYISWFKNGAPPKITRDGLYYLYRSHSAHAAPDLSAQRSPFELFRGSDKPTDDIEVILFLSAPATVKVVVDKKEYSRDLDSGFSSYRVPLGQGKPAFSIIRNGLIVLERRGEVSVSNTIRYQDLIYRGGGVVVAQ